MSLAKSVVNDCLRISRNDNVAINLYPHNLSLAEDIVEECFKKGADVIMSLYTDRFFASQYNHLSAEALRQPSVFCRALTENSTAEIFMSGTYDPTILRKLDPEKLAADAEGEDKAHMPLAKERKIRTLNITSALVTKPRAKVYGFSYDRWNKMMQAASAVDYKKLAKTGRALLDSVRDAKSIEVTGTGGTRVSFDVGGRKWLLSDGVVDEEDIRNGNYDDQIPAGTLYVAPVEETAKGSVHFNAAVPLMGRLVTGVSLEFEDGRVSKLKGNASAAKLKEIYEKGTGDKDRIGYFGIGFNPWAETGYIVNNVAYGAVSIGIGGNDFVGGKNKAGFFHLGTLTGATVAADGKTVLKLGKLVIP